MSEQQLLEDEVVLDRITAALVERPKTFSELFAFCCFVGEPMPRLGQVDEALDILHNAGALEYMKDRRAGERVKVFRLKSESRTYWICEYCEGAGFQPDAKRGLCPVCHGNGMITPIPQEAIE